MAVYKRGNTWWYEFVFNGKRVRDSTKQSNKRVATDIEAAKRTQLAKGEVGIKDRKKAPTLTTGTPALGAHPCQARPPRARKWPPSPARTASRRILSGAMRGYSR
jgi:hypothetical protein